MLVGITGKIGSGKSTLARFLCENGFTEDSFAIPLKQIGEIFGFSKESLYGTQESKLQIHEKWGISSRVFLQKVGEIFRDVVPKFIPEMKIDDTVWVDLFRLRYREGKNVVVSDVRFLDEAEAIRNMGGIIIRVVRDNDVSSKDGSEHLHVSETEMDKIEPDFTLDNNVLSIEEVQKAVLSIINN